MTINVEHPSGPAVNESFLKIVGSVMKFGYPPGLGDTFSDVPLTTRPSQRLLFSGCRSRVSFRDVMPLPKVSRISFRNPVMPVKVQF